MSLTIEKDSQWFIEETIGDQYRIIFVGKGKNSLSKTVCKFMELIRIEKNKNRNFEIWSRDYANTSQGWTAFMRFKDGKLFLSGLASVTIDKNLLGITN